MAAATADPTLVRCKGQGLTFGYFGRPIESTIDTRRAGPGELTVYCTGPVAGKPAECELVDHKNGLFSLTLRPQLVGFHSLNILYDDQHVLGSPFALRVSAASLIKVGGTGLQDGLLSNYKPQFYVDTSEAGKGEVRVEVGGPRGAFKIETKQDGKILRCLYHVREPGKYIVNVFWCGDHAADSPYHVYIWRTADELQRNQILREQIPQTKSQSERTAIDHAS